MAKLTPDQWDEIRARYEGGLSATKLAAKYGVTRQGIMKRVNKEGWIQDLSRDIERTTRAKVQRTPVERPQDIDTQGAEQEVTYPTAEKLPPRNRKKLTHERREVIESESDKLAKIILRHREEWNIPDTMLITALKVGGVMPWSDKDRAAGLPEKHAKDSMFDMLKSARITIEILSMKQNGQRRAWGLDRIEQPRDDNPNMDGLASLSDEELEHLEQLLAKVEKADAACKGS